MRAYVRTIWKLATLMFTLVTCLLAHAAPALAIPTSSYFADVYLRIDRCHALVPQCAEFPAGTGFTTSLTSSSFLTPPPTLTGDATASSGGGQYPGFAPFPPFQGSVGVSTQGIATTPPNSFASSFVSGVFTGVLYNQNNTTQTFPVFLWFSSFSGSTPAPYPFATAESHSAYRFVVDGDPLLTGADQRTGATPNFPFFFPPPPEVLLLTFPLAPGVHSYRLDVEAEGFAYAGTATPEPMTLLLFGTTAVGLGLARWRRRGRNHEHAA
jgi:hypothetical protein